MSDEIPDPQNGFIRAHKRMLNAFRNILALLGAATLAVGAATVTMPALSSAITAQLNSVWSKWADPVGTIISAVVSALVAVLAAWMTVRPAQRQASIAVLETLRLEQSQINSVLQILGECGARQHEITATFSQPKIAIALNESKFQDKVSELRNIGISIFNISDNFSNDSEFFKILRSISNNVHIKVDKYNAIINKFSSCGNTPKQEEVIEQRQNSLDDYNCTCRAIELFNAEKKRLSEIMDKIRRDII